MCKTTSPFPTLTPERAMSNNLISTVNRLSGHSVLVIGDVMLDRYVYGQVERISPEAPIPVMHIQRESLTLGGAGNVARNIAALGGNVAIIGVEIGRAHV